MTKPLTTGALVLALLASSTVHAQIPVTDVANLAEIIKILSLERTMYRLKQEAYATLQRERMALPNMARYRLEGLPMTGHDLDRFAYGADILRGLNGGDADGIGWQRSTQRLRVPGPLFYALPAEAQQLLRTSYASIELIDSTAILAGHQVGLTRGYAVNLQNKVDELQRDTLNGVSEPTANLDKLVVAEGLKNRAAAADSQLTSSMVEMLMAREKVQRDAEAEALNMQLENAGRLMNDSVAGSSAVLRNWYRR